MKRHLSGMVLGLVIIFSLLCSCGQARPVQDETSIATQCAPGLAQGDRGTDTPTAALEKDQATPTVVAQRTSSPTGTSVPEPTHTSLPTHTPQLTATSTPVPPTPTPGVVVYVVQAGDTLATISCRFTVPLETIAAANDIQDLNAIHVGQELVIPGLASAPASVQTPVETSSRSPTVSAAPLPELKQLEDRAPGPPFTIEVSLNRVTRDPLVEQSRTYLVTGIVRNDSDETYAVSDILVTFYDAEGFRGTFEPAIRDGKVVGGEWHWHGETCAEFAALLLAPGEEWPFRVAIVGQDMASFLIHPDALPTGRESAPVELSDVQVVDGGTNHVRITGMATNGNPFKIKNVAVSGVLLDGSEQIVSIGSKYVLQEDIAPGASVRFEVRIEKEPSVRYQLYVQAERDWE